VTTINPAAAIKQSGIHLQETSYTCGPASILNALRLTGCPELSEATLAAMCDTRHGVGTTNEALHVGCHRAGLHIVEAGRNATVEKLKPHLRAVDDLTLPVQPRVVIVNYCAFTPNGHYSVVTQYDDRAIYLADCSFGPLRLEFDEFAANWHDHTKTIHGWYLAVTAPV
jgi:predicted double-glycine peptidase